MTKTAKVNKDLDRWLVSLKARVAEDKMKAANRRLCFQLAWQAKFGKPYPQQ